jgi:hypothetical protein
MATPLEVLKQRYAEAEAALAASVTAVEGSSKKRLTAVLALPAQERFDHLGDPMLTPADALALTRSLRVVTKPKVLKPARATVLQTLGRWTMLKLKSPVTVVMIAMAVAYVVVLWSRTPRGITISQPVEIALQYPDGRKIPALMNPGKIYWLIQTYGDRAVIRIWMPITGYQEFEVPVTIVQSST